MAYEKINWKSGKTGGTLVNSTNLNKMDKGIYDNSIDIENIKEKNTTQDTKIAALETSSTDHQRRITQLENKSTQLETKNTEQDELITELRNKNNEQDELIAELEIEVNELKDNVLTNEVEGTSIHIEDSANARILDLEIEGNSYQETGENMPSPDYPSEVQTIKGNISIVVAGNNFFNDENLVTKDCTYINNNHSLTVTATYSYAYIQQKVENLVLGQTYYYYHSGDNATWLVVKNSNGTKIAEAYASKSVSFTAPSDGFVTISIYATSSSTSGTKTFTNLIVATEKNLSYEPYQENTTYIDLQDNEICKIGDIKDELDLITGILTKRIGKKVLDGSEEWFIGGENSYFYSVFEHIGISPKPNNEIKTTHFIYSKTNGAYISDSSLAISLNCLPNMTLEEFKTWLSENNVTVYYQLATPYEVNLGKIEMPKTINHVTNINLLATLESNMKLKYVRSANVVIENLAKAIIAVGGEV